MSIPEQRFREGSGIKYCVNGKIRCHALAKSRIRQWREDFNDYDTPSEELWPECQCHKPAIDGLFVCGYHGGDTPRTVNPPRSLVDVMPLDMAEKFRAVMENPDYISRKEDILLIKTRQWELLEELQVEAGSDEAWGMVHEALVKLRQGNDIAGLDLLARALETTQRKQEIYREIYTTEKLLGDLTNTQMKTVEKLQKLATTEQVNALINNILYILTSRIDVYIEDPARQQDYRQMIIGEIRKLANFTPQAFLND